MSKRITEEEFRLRLDNKYSIIKYNGYSKISTFKCNKHNILINKTSKNFLLHSCRLCTNEALLKSQEKARKSFKRNKSSISKL